MRTEPIWSTRDAPSMMRVALCFAVFVVHWVVSAEWRERPVLSQTVLIVRFAAEMESGADAPRRLALASHLNTGSWTDGRCAPTDKHPHGGLDPSAVNDSVIYLECRFLYGVDAAIDWTGLNAEGLQGMLRGHGIRLRHEYGLNYLPMRRRGISDPIWFARDVLFSSLAAMTLALLSGWRASNDWAIAARGLRRASIRFWVLMPLFAAALGGFVAVRLGGFGDELLWLGGSEHFGLAAYAFGALLVAPATEEWIFRGWLLYGLGHRVRPAYLIALSMFAFAAAHNVSLLSAVSIAVSGMLLAILWYRSRSLLLCMLAHALTNLPNVVRAWLAAS